RQAAQPVDVSRIAGPAPPPLSLWGEGPGVRAPDSKTALRPLTGLIARALSLTLSPVGRGNWSSGAAYSEVIEGPCLPEPPDSAAGASKQNSRIRALPPLPPEGAGGEGRGFSDCYETSYGPESSRPLPVSLSPEGGN